MDRNQKAEVVDALRTMLSDAGAVVITRPL